MNYTLYKDAEERSAHILRICEELALILEKKREELTTVLLRYESYETVHDELWRSADCLKNINKELKYLSRGRVRLMCTFFPVNLPLYSLVVFAIVPGFMAEELFVRTPRVMSDIAREIYAILELDRLLPHIKLITIERSLFRDAYVSIADSVLFTGRYENAKLIQESCPNSLLIYNGAGINPIIVTDSADLEFASDKIIEMRVFNSGQDCAGSDSILVHEKIAPAFRDILLRKVGEIKTGEYSRKDVRVGKLAKADHIKTVRNFLEIHKNAILQGGEIDEAASIVYPTVLEEDMNTMTEITYNEFFSPIFYLVVYHTTAHLEKYFSSTMYKEHAMYVSVFGEGDVPVHIPNSVILKNKIVNDVERGNNPYGGYGSRANYVSYAGITQSRPLLISEEMSKRME